MCSTVHIYYNLIKGIPLVQSCVELLSFSVGSLPKIFPLILDCSENGSPKYQYFSLVSDITTTFVFINLVFILLQPNKDFFYLCYPIQLCISFTITHLIFKVLLWFTLSCLLYQLYTSDFGHLLMALLKWGSHSFSSSTVSEIPPSKLLSLCFYLNQTLKLSFSHYHFDFSLKCLMHRFSSFLHI